MDKKIISALTDRIGILSTIAREVYPPSPPVEVAWVMMTCDRMKAEAMYFASNLDPEEAESFLEHALAALRTGRIARDESVGHA